MISIDKPKHTLYRWRHSFNTIQLIVVFNLLLFFIPLSRAANQFQVVIPKTAAEGLPQVIQRVITALDQTGLDIQVETLPNNRALYLFTNGKVALDGLRTQGVFEKHPDIIEIHPAVLTMTFRLVTSIQAPHNCQATMDDLAQMNSAGIFGIELYHSMLNNYFKETTELQDLNTAAKFVAEQRADVIFLPEQAFNVLPQAILEKLLNCNTLKKTFKFHSYLHKNFLWAKPKIEKAYLEEFGKNNNP